MISIGLIVWLIDRLTYCVNQRINQLIYGWKNNSMSCSKKQFKHYFHNQRIGILLLGYHMFSYILNQSIICSCFWLMNGWRIGSMPIVQAIFIISLTNNNANNKNIVNEYQNRWLIMRIICVQKQCMEEIWNDEQQQQQLMNEWTITWVIIQINKLSIQYSVRYRIIPIYSIQCPISNNTNLWITNNFGKERAIIWIIT